ncbi:hypothetical protein QA648_36535 (plasmid) [Rhizobium sp. CB3171]|uniref:hypothetical protein n=1 Tax=Rhizobium sp. CB3171 TaxID=3039157 RepID=UPI0024B05075|nr:hypothetical protein [Rhizobium sp. CB3171]WFU07439.1 hypothetical protein QA648_36535 [Rhizobium sp. CB3171]
MITLRYELKKNNWNGYWSINDVFTGQPVVVDGHAVDLTKDEAEYLIDLLNVQDLIQRNALKPKR